MAEEEKKKKKKVTTARVVGIGLGSNKDII